MKEVSCKAFAPLEAALVRGLLAPRDLLDGIDYDLAHLRDKHERIEWSAYRRLVGNAARHLEPLQFEMLGRSFSDSPAFRVGMVVARLLFSPAKLLQLMQGMEREGKGMFTCVKSTLRPIGADRIELDLQISDGYEDCPEFFYITKGAFEGLLGHLGSPGATLDAELGQRAAHLNLYVPDRERVFTRIKRALKQRSSMAAAAAELQEAHGVLLKRHGQLEEARSRLDVQARQLRIAHQVSQLIQQEIELVGTLDAIASALCTGLRVPGVEVSVDTESENVAVRESARHGSPSGASLQREMHVRGRQVGELRIWVSDKSDELEETVDLILPSIVMAVENALTYDSVVRYRDELEIRVEERTRELAGARDALAESLSALESAQAARERIFENINHEIRTPLSIIQIAADDACRLAGEGEARRAAQELGAVQRNVGRLLQLVDGLLLLAASDEKKLRFSPETADLSALLATEVNAWMPLARKHGIELSCGEAPDCHARVDVPAMQRALSNLISNALKFTPRGGTVSASIARHGEEIEIRIADSGIGMDPEFAARAFERFSQGPRPVHAGFGGSGIGLALVKEILEAFDGSASVESSIGAGATFILRLPATVGHAAASVSSVSPSAHWQVELVPEPEEGGLAHRHTILVVDDEPELRRAIAGHLSSKYRVVVAPDGETALELAALHRPDMLVADVHMPGMSGIELTERFCELSSIRLATVLLLTADATQATRIRGFEGGAIDYMTKPFHFGELEARVKAQLQLRDLALQLHESERLASVGLLGAGLAHEVRNPANGIVNGLRALKRYLDEAVLAKEPRAAQLWRVIEEAATGLVETCRSLSELENARHLVLSQVRLCDLIEMAVKTRPADERGRIEVDCSPGLTVECSPRLISQVLINLIDNASAVRRERISIRATADDAFVRVTVLDDGPGISREDRGRVFEPFYTTKSPGAGVGLGLTVSRQVALRHGGSLEIRDGAGGCAMELSLPLIAATEAH